MYGFFFVDLEDMFVLRVVSTIDYLTKSLTTPKSMTTQLLDQSRCSGRRYPREMNWSQTCLFRPQIVDQCSRHKNDRRPDAWTRVRPEFGCVLKCLSVRCSTR